MRIEAQSYPLGIDLFNKFGNRTNATSSLGTERIEYPNATTIKRYVGGNTWTYTLGQRGNMVSAYGGRSFTYDGDNNLVAMSNGSDDWTFRYNAANQMVYSKRAIYGKTIDERFYVYDGLDVVAEVATDGTVYREFLRAGQAIGSVVAEVVHEDPEVASQYWNQTCYYHYNHRGDVIAVSDWSGAFVFRADYDAYGNMIWSSGSFTPRYTFSTKRCFEDFGTYYYGYRWYLPELGRWMQKDLSEINSDGLNAYAFCRNRPTGTADSFGLISDDELVSNFGEAYRDKVVDAGVSPGSVFNPLRSDQTINDFMSMDSTYNHPDNQSQTYEYQVAPRLSAEFSGSQVTKECIL